MAAIDYPLPVRNLISRLKQLPGIGPKSAERIAIWLIQHGREEACSLAASLSEASERVGECELCGFFSVSGEGCRICQSVDRDSSSLCVVEHPTDVLLLERAGAFRGHYHVLRGKISPLDNVSPDDLRIGELMERLKAGAFMEVIFALSADVEGEATAHFLAEQMADFPGVRVTRLAHGISVGGGLESADELTLLRALEGRVGMKR